MTVTLNLAFAGLGIGAVAALAGLGLVVTYRATGVFNLAFGAIAVSQAFVENVAMSKQKKIVAITTTLGSIANAARATAPFYYRVTKSALNMSMQALGTELRPKGIIVAVCSPGAMDTAIIAAFKS